MQATFCNSSQNLFRQPGTTYFSDLLFSLIILCRSIPRKQTTLRTHKYPCISYPNILLSSAYSAMASFFINSGTFRNASNVTVFPECVGNNTSAEEILLLKICFKR